MMRKAWLAIVLVLGACYPPPSEPDPGKIAVQPLLPTPLLDPSGAACTGGRIAGDAAAAARRLERTVKKVEGRYAGYSRYRYWWSEDYEASYDAAQAAARTASFASAAEKAAGRVSAHPESAADYAELALAHASAFAAAERGRDGRRRSAEGTVRAMARSQPDLELLYQQEFERRYGGEKCGAAAPDSRRPPAGDRTPGIPVVTGEILPLLPTPLLDRARAACAAGLVAERAGNDWLRVYAREVGADTTSPAAPAGRTFVDWRASRAFADLAGVHAGLFALGSAPDENDVRQELESRIRKVTRANPGLERAYQDAFAPSYAGPACRAR